MTTTPTEVTTTPEETPVEGGGEEGETISIEEEFRELLGSSAEIRERVQKISAQVSSKQTVTGEDLAILYGFLEGDVLSLVYDLVQATGAGLNDAIQYLEEEGEGDEGGSDEEDDEPDDVTIQVYATLQANAAAFQNLATLDAIPKDQKEGLAQMLQMNRDTMSMIRENVGEEVAERAAAWIQAAQQQVVTEQQAASSDG